MIEPETQDAIYKRIRDAIASASAITNWSPNSPEKAITDDGFAAEQRERQHEELAVQLSSYIDYAGKGTDESEEPINENDLDDLEVADPEAVDLDLLNSYIERNDLDQLVKRYSIFRDPGAFAEGSVTFQTSSEEVVIPDGTTVGTQPDADGDFLAFVTTKEVVSSEGSTSVDAPIQATERGTAFNVGSGTITYLPESVPGVGGDPPVNNANATTGGEAEETNAELRARAKEQLVGTSGGGTLQGVENGLVAAFAGLDQEDVKIVEYPNQDPVTFDYVVDGGPTDSDLRNKIDDLRPVAIEGTLVRPTQVTLDLDVDVKGTDVDTASVEQDLREYVNGLGLGDEYVLDKVVQITMNADAGIDSIESITTTIVDETETFQSTQSVYAFDRAPIVPDSIRNVEDASGDAYVEGTDYDDVDSDADGDIDSIDWSVGGASPNDGENWTMDYDVDHDVAFGTQEKAVIGTATVQVV
ncbi:MAG: baseplate J/gp47 family protein [Halobacteria archaeon]|nr:baseplate J/gp47 family protein [Halobacteria archaeon]